MMMNSIDSDIIFSKNLIETRYPNFDYAIKNCFYCKKELTLVKTYHLLDTPFDYKGIYVCYNQSCDAFDEPAQRAYVKVYYSSPRAAKYLDGIKSNIIQPKKV